MESRVFPRFLEGLKEGSMQSARKSVQSDETSSLALLIDTDSPSLQDLGFEAPFSQAPDRNENSASADGHAARDPGQKLSLTHFQPGWHQSGSFAKSLPERSGNRHLCWVLVVVLLSILSVVGLGYCVYLHGQLKEQADQIHFVFDALKIASSNKTDDVSRTGDGHGSSLDISSVLDYARRRVKRDEWSDFFRAQFRDYFDSMPKIHLHGMQRNSTETVTEQRYLLWQQDTSVHGILPGNRVGLMYHNNAFNRIKGVEIKQEGVYLVYAQAIIEGVHPNHFNHTAHRDDCTHETVVLNHQESNPRVLMSGYLTQDGSGKRGHVHRTWDTSFQMGIFRFLRQDHIVVRQRHDADCRFINITSRDFDAAYFGLVRIA